MLRKPVALWRSIGLGAVITALTPAAASPQEPRPPEAAPPPDSSPRFERTFNFDATWGTFGFLNSLYTDPKPDEPSGDLGEGWSEGSMKAALTIGYTTASAWKLWGKASAVGERTYGPTPSLVGSDASSFQVEDLAVGIRSGTALSSLGENALELTIGRAPYKLGHAWLVGDGSSEGGSRGGYWTNARKAFAFASIARFQPAPHTVEAFYLVRDHLPEADSDTRLAGVNYEARVAETTTLGATYLRFWANDLQPQRRGLNVYNIRAYTAPLPGLQQLSFEFEYGRERNSGVLDSQAWTLQGGYELIGLRWTPVVSYRYASFQGDNPATATSEAWDPLVLTFHDWGTWFQGEIAGGYFVTNSNLQSHQVRVHLTPSKTLGTGFMVYDFRADQPVAIAPTVTANDVAIEWDWYADWKVHKNLTISLVAALADPGKVVQQLNGRTKNFVYAMAFVAYSY